jgi:DNA helicase HerA-like ATPase
MLGTDAFRDQDKQSQMPDAPLGHVHSVSGSQVSIGLASKRPGGLYGAGTTVGKFVKIKSGKALIVGVIAEISVQAHTLVKEQDIQGMADVDLMGEIGEPRAPEAGPVRFHRGVTTYPTIGDAVEPLTYDEMRTIFDGGGPRSIKVGHLQQDATIDVRIDIGEMLTKHFAVLGTTGVGKSSALVIILQQLLQARPELRVLLLDVHNEYGRCFGDRAYVANPGNLRLPFWLFNFEEIIDVFFAGRSAGDEEMEILSEVIPLAKVAYTQYRSSAERLAVKKLDPKSIGYTVDTPVPYRLQDLLMMIDERMGKLENRSSRMIYHKLITRIETVSNDARYAFLFEKANVGGDTMAESISQLFRLPADGKPMTIMQLAGFPAEVVDPVVSVLCRLAFDFGLWSDGAAPLLIVCEEAHRYASVDRTIGFAPTRRAISRIAKEGRKCGVFLALATQRAAELDPTIISQCSTLFAMRMSNDRDQALLRSAVADTAANLFGFVPSLGTREALAFGVGVPLPTRLTFSELPAHLIPRCEAFANERAVRTTGHDLNFIVAVLERWRRSMARSNNPDDAARDLRSAVRSDAAPLQPSAAPESNRFSLLKKPLANLADPFSALRGPASPKR